MAKKNTKHIYINCMIVTFYLSGKRSQCALREAIIEANFQIIKEEPDKSPYTGIYFTVKVKSETDLFYLGVRTAQLEEFIIIDKP